MKTGVDRPFSLPLWFIAGGLIAFFGLSLPSIGLVVLSGAVVTAALLSWRLALPLLLTEAAMPLLLARRRKGRLGFGDAHFAGITSGHARARRGRRSDR